MGAVIGAERLTKTYRLDVTALAGVSFSAQPGEFVAVLGPSGAGKTTLFRCLTGLTRPDAGAVVLDGRDLCRMNRRELRSARRDIALIFQQFNLIRRLTAVQNVLAGRLALVPTWRVLLRRFARPDRQLALRCLDAVGLLDRAHARADQLSGGQQQRVAIARALVSRPTVVFADEPTGNLDSKTGGEILELLRRSVEEYGQTTVMVTHDPGAAAIADRILFLADGMIVKDIGSASAHDVVVAMEELDRT